MEFKKWECIVCGLIYDEEQGWPDDGIEPGTRWEDVPSDWLCPGKANQKEHPPILYLVQSHRLANPALRHKLSRKQCIPIF